MKGPPNPDGKILRDGIVKTGKSEPPVPYRSQLGPSATVPTRPRNVGRSQLPWFDE